MVLGDICPDIFPGYCSGIHCCLHNASILTCICTTWPSRAWTTSVGMFHRPLLKAATHHWYIVLNMYSNPSVCPYSFPQVYNATPFKWLKLFNSSTYSWVGMLRARAHTHTHTHTHTVYFSEHHSQNRGCKDRPPERHLIADDRHKWITSSPTHHYAILYSGANERSPWGVAVFRQYIYTGWN